MAELKRVPTMDPRGRKSMAADRGRPGSQGARDDGNPRRLSLTRGQPFLHFGKTIDIMGWKVNVPQGGGGVIHHPLRFMSS